MFFTAAASHSRINMDDGFLHARLRLEPLNSNDLPLIPDIHPVCGFIPAAKENCPEAVVPGIGASFLRHTVETPEIRVYGIPGQIVFREGIGIPQCLLALLTAASRVMSSCLGTR